MYKAVTFVACTAISASSFGQLDREWTFETDGELPSADPDVAYFSFSGIPEDEAFAVAKGMLIQTIMPVTGPTGYFFPDFPPKDGGLDPLLPTVVEARLRIIAIENLGGVWFGALDGQHRYDIRFTKDGPAIVITDGEHIVIPANVFEFHTYRLESPGYSGELALYIDGELAEVVEVPLFTQWNGMRWGGGTEFSNATGDAEWDFVRITQLEDVGCPADLNDDASVGVSDLLILLAFWGPCSPVCLGDLDGNGNVGVSDLLALLANWGPCP